MRGQAVGGEAGFDRQLLQQLAGTLPRQMPDAARWEEPAGGSRSGQKTLAAAEIGGKRQPARLAQRHGAFPAPLARYQEKPRVALRRGERQRDQLGDAHAGRIEQLDEANQADAFVSGPGASGRDQPVDLVFRKDLWQRAAESGGIETRRRVVPADAGGHQKLVELAHGRNSASECSWRERRRGSKIRMQGGCISSLRGLPPGAKEASV